MKKLVDYAQQNLTDVSVGVTVGLAPPRKGIGIEFTLQPKNLRWGFRLRHKENNLFYAIEQRPGLFHYGLRGYYCSDGRSYMTKFVPHPLTLKEIIVQWPQNFWPEGLKLLDHLAKVNAQ